MHVFLFLTLITVAVVLIKSITVGFLRVAGQGEGEIGVSLFAIIFGLGSIFAEPYLIMLGINRFLNHVGSSIILTFWETFFLLLLVSAIVFKANIDGK